MPYIRGADVDRYYQRSLEGRAERIQAAIVEHVRGERPEAELTFLATGDGEALALDETGRVLRAEFGMDGGVPVGIAVAEATDVRVVAEADVPAYVREGLAAVVEGGPDARTRVRELMQLVRSDEAYWLSDLLGQLEEASEEGWYHLYEANADRIRTTLHGSIREIEAAVPRTRFAKIAQRALPEFVEELRESFGTIRDAVQQVVDGGAGMVFDGDDEFDGAIHESLMVEAQATVGLLSKVERLLRADDMGRAVVAHDRVAERARNMRVAAAYVRRGAQQPDDQE